MSSRRAITISLKDLRISKAHKVSSFKPCSGELDSYIAALEHGDDKRSSTLRLAEALFSCLEEHRNAAKPVSLGYHLSKYVDRKKY